MKAKIIGIVYVDFLRGIGSAEKLFHDIVKELKDEGRVETHADDRTVRFEDGTRVYKIGSSSMMDRRLTHAYIDEGVFDLVNGERVVRELILPSIVPQGRYANIDANTDIGD